MIDLKFKQFYSFFAVVLFSTTVFAQAKIILNVGDAKLRKSKLAIPSFNHLGSNPNHTQLTVGTTLHSVINNDLSASGLFVVQDPAAFLEDTTTKALKPVGATDNGFDFANWKSIETEFLIRGGYQIINSNVVLEIYAYYVPQGNLLIGKKYEGPAKNIRKIAHTFSNDFMKAVTGKPSFFNSQIIVAIDNGPKTNREIYLADWDGHNATAVTDHKTITVSPAWSRNGEYVAYTAFVKRKIGREKPKRNPDLFIYELKPRRRWLVSYRDGLNSGAEFMDDNKHLLVTLSFRGSADIYKMTLDGKNIVPLTKGPGAAMNVEPALSPDGQTIAFSSDRSGKPMIYKMNTDGSNVRRLTFAGNFNATPSWSADGKKIAFAGFDRDKDNFDIFVMNADGNGLMRLTAARKANGKWANNEDPAFTPDGRQVLFVSDRSGTKQLYIVNADGTNERRITYDSRHYSKPKWGPLTE